MEGQQKIAEPVDLPKEATKQLPKQYEEFRDLFTEVQDLKALPAHQDWDHEIILKEDAKPVCEPLRRMNDTDSRTLKIFIDEMLAKGHIRESKSPWGAPIFFVRKPGTDKRRPVVDWRKLNDRTIKDCYSLPLLDDLRDRTQGSKIFTQIDLKSAFNLVRMKEGDEGKTAFRTQWGLYEFLVMHFGLCNAPATFQRLVNNALREYIDVFCIVYLDDILIYSKDVAEHEKHVKLVFRALRDHHMKISLDKCHFAVKRVKFCGHIITTEGFEMDLDKVKAVLEWEPPTNVKETQSFLGFCNYYRRYIKNYSSIAKVLTDLTHKDIVFKWTAIAQAAMDALKKMFSKEPILVHNNPERKKRVESDSSDFAIGAVYSSSARTVAGDRSLSSLGNSRLRNSITKSMIKSCSRS